MNGFEATPDEFRSLFRATDSIDIKRQLLLATGESNAKTLGELDAQRQEAIKKALPAGRFQAYKLNQDPEWREFRGVATTAGIPTESLMTV